MQTYPTLTVVPTETERQLRHVYLRQREACDRRLPEYAAMIAEHYGDCVGFSRIYSDQDVHRSYRLCGFLAPNGSVEQIEVFADGQCVLRATISGDRTYENVLAYRPDVDSGHWVDWLVNLGQQVEREQLSTRAGQLFKDWGPWDER